MSKTKLTKILEKELWRATRKLGTFGCFEVTIGWFGKERVDYMTYDTKGTWRCYEIKVSKNDFYSKSKTTFVGHYNYYVMPQELYNQVAQDIPEGIGVYVFNGWGLRLVKRPKYKDLAVDINVPRTLVTLVMSKWYDNNLQNNNNIIV